MSGNKGNALGTNTSFPDWMEAVHQGFLGVDAAGSGDTMTLSVQDAMKAAINDGADALDSPYPDHSYIDPTTKIATMQSAASLILANIPEDSDLRTNWNSTISSVMTELAAELGTDFETLQTLVATEWEDLDDQARVQLATLITDTHIHTVLAFFETWGNIYTAVKDKADADISDRSLNTTDRSGDVTDRSSNVSDRSGDVTEQSSTDRSGDTTDNSAVALAEIDDHNTIHTAIATKVNALIAIGNYEVSDADIVTLKSAFEGTIQPEYEKRLSEFHGGMAALNAINSSAFMIGGALIMRGLDRDLANFEADLRKGNIDSKIKFYQDRMKYIDLFSRIYATIDFNAMTALKDSKASYETAKAGLMTGFEGYTKELLAAHQVNTAQLLASYETTFNQAMNSYETAYAQAMTSYETAKAQLMVSYETLYSGFIQDLSKTYASIDYNKAQVGSAMQIAYENRRVQYQIEALKGMISMLLAQAQLRWQLLGAGTSLIESRSNNSLEGYKAYANAAMDAQRLAHLLDSDYTAKELELDVEHLLFPLKVYQYGSNVLSGIAGGGTVFPEKPSQGSQALAGALGGAAAGASLGPAGMAIGAALGGIGGYLS